MKDKDTILLENKLIDVKIREVLMGVAQGKIKINQAEKLIKKINSSVFKGINTNPNEVPDCRY